MVAAKEIAAENINKKPLIRRNPKTGEMKAGFLNPETGEFEAVMDIAEDGNIDEFLDTYNLSVVMISKR